MVSIDCPFENFESFCPKDCPKMLEWSWNFVKTLNLIRQISYMIMNTIATSGFLGRPQKSHFFQPSLKKVNFHWRFIRWRSRHRKNLIANFYGAVNLRFTICKLLFQEEKKSKKSPKIWAYGAKNSCLAIIFFQLDYI